MRELKTVLGKSNAKLFLHTNKLIFLQEALFHSSEVDYFTVKENSKFHVFDAEEVIKIIEDATTLINSKASQAGQMDDQKVVFKLKEANVTIGEIEMRNDSKTHYREIKFWMDREKTLALLKKKINVLRRKSDRIIAYGKAASRFKL